MASIPASGTVANSEEQSTTSLSDDSIINPSILEQPRKAHLPVNVGFVPGSEPEARHESKEEEEEDEKTDVSRPMDYEDAVTSTTISSGSSSAETQAPSDGSTTEPPLQLVQDLIDALAGGGLNAILGAPRKQTFAPEFADRKLECASGHMRFVASELTDLSTRFDADAVVYSLQHCAKICYETGCTLAAFTRYPRPVCMMRYDNATICDNNNNSDTTFWRFTGIQQVVRLDCIKCGTY
ncbi:unnamed protein product [Nippostrongylus brasiliensis]|uniref:WSC domain-containing protein n=1 Tax=Nippostrongylus brasiliensis TaxID=27835 RepID=A0A0N4XZ13_NIPBR|nr:unnamed protein product [Nippostrongylus brasiliensis]